MVLIIGGPISVALGALVVGLILAPRWGVVRSKNPLTDMKDDDFVEFADYARRAEAKFPSELMGLVNMASNRSVSNLKLVIESGGGREGSAFVSFKGGTKVHVDVVVDHVSRQI
ncbi:hypothetical protein ACLOJK_012388 [Asimina triloba]